MLKTADIVEHAEQKVGTYSKGMKQRLALARALLHEPEVLFLDEPTSGLDPIAAHHVHQLITHLSKEEGRTVFLCTHNLVEAQQLCDRVAVLEHGRLIALGTPGELIRQLEQGLRLMVVALGGFVIYSIVTNLVAWPVMGQATGLVLFNIWLAVLLGLLMWGVDVLLLWIGGRVFQRGEIITRL